MLALLEQSCLELEQRQQMCLCWLVEYRLERLELCCCCLAVVCMLVRLAQSCSTLGCRLELREQWCSQSLTGRMQEEDRLFHGALGRPRRARPKQSSSLAR